MHVLALQHDASASYRRILLEMCLRFTRLSVLSSGHWQATDRCRKGVIFPLRMVPAPTFNELIFVVADIWMPQYVFFEPEDSFC